MVEPRLHGHCRNQLLGNHHRLLLRQQRPAGRDRASGPLAAIIRASSVSAITGEIASCVFPLNPRPPVPDNVAVELDGARLAQDPGAAGGWHYGANNDSIALAGAAFDKVKTSPSSNVQIIYGCPNVVIP